MAYQNKEVIYDLLFKASAETMLTIAADPKHLGARIGITSVLHTWGSAMTHHPHVHMIVPGGGISLDGKRWVSCKPGFFLPVRVLSRLFRRLFLEMLIAAHKADRLQFFDDHAALADFKAFAAYAGTAHAEPNGWSMPSVRSADRNRCWPICRATRTALPSPTVGWWRGTDSVTFKWKDYRLEGPDRYKMMTLATGEFIRRFLMHVLPKRFHRIRHYGLFANGTRADNIARARELLKCRQRAGDDSVHQYRRSRPLSHRCPCCGGRMIIIETFERGATPRYRPAASTAVIRIDTS